MKTTGSSEIAMAPKTIFVLKREPSCAARHPQAQQAARQDQPEDKQRGDDKRGDRIEDHDFIPTSRLKGQVERAEREYPCEQQRDQQTAEYQPELALPAAGGHARNPLRRASAGR